MFLNTNSTNHLILFFSKSTGDNVRLDDTGLSSNLNRMVALLVEEEQSEEDMVNWHNKDSYI